MAFSAHIITAFGKVVHRRRYPIFRWVASDHRNRDSWMQGVLRYIAGEVDITGLRIVAVQCTLILKREKFHLLIGFPSFLRFVSGIQTPILEGHTRNPANHRPISRSEFEA